MKKFILALALVLACGSIASGANPTSIGMRSYTTAGTYPTACSVAGVVYEAPYHKLMPSTLRTYTLTRGAMAKYSTAKNPNIGEPPNQYYISCVRLNTGVEQPIKMFFDSDETKYFPISKDFFRLK